MSSAQRLMLDTHVFDRLIDGKLSDRVIHIHAVFITHIQRDELARAQGNRRDELLAKLQVIAPIHLPTETSIWDDTPWDDSFWSGDEVYQPMLQRLCELDRKSKKLENQSRDIRIAETALKNNLTLLSDDQNLRHVITEFGGKALSTIQLLSA